MRIKFAEINGLYSYSSEKNRINFGEKTVLVGTNNSGKSAIFKALNYFLKCLTTTRKMDTEPWALQDTHEMTIGLMLNDVERKYVAEILTVRSEDGSPTSLAPDHIVEWLTPRLEHVEITIILDDNPYLSNFEQVRYAIYMKGLNVTVCSQGYNSGAVWACKSAGFSPRRVANAEPFYMVVENLLKKNPASGADTEEKMDLDWPTECRISEFPPYTIFVNSQPRNKGRIEFLLDMSGHKISNYECSFFIMLGRMLEQKFAFVSDQRKFQKSNDFEMLPLSDDGSNLQSFLYWLQNGNRDEQNECSTIQEMFSGAMKQQRLSFIVSITKRRESTKNTAPAHQPDGKVYPDRAIVQFAETYGGLQRFTDFMDIGTGVRETLFLLAKCFGQKDGVILLDEPAVNLHPTQIRHLMSQIVSPGARTGQIAIVTHSPALASLEMLSSANEIARVDRQEYSRIIQPFGEDRAWIKENLPKFHMLKSDIMFAKKVVLVEGSSDKIFLEAILNHGSRLGDDIVIVDVGGTSSFAKFCRFLEIFGISYGIFADQDVKERFGTKEILEISLESIPHAVDMVNKRVCILEKDLEWLLANLDLKLYEEIKKEYEKKPERAHEFVKRFFAYENSNDASNTVLKLIREWIMAC